MAKKPAQPKRQTRVIDLSDEAIGGLDAIYKVEGMKQKEMLSRLVEWFVGLDRPCRQLVLGNLPSEYAQDASERLARKSLERVHEIEGTNAPPAVKERRAS